MHNFVRITICGFYDTKPKKIGYVKLDAIELLQSYDDRKGDEYYMVRLSNEFICVSKESYNNLVKLLYGKESENV